MKPLALALGMMLLADAAFAVEKGDKAPEFESKDDQGRSWKSTDHVGKHVLVVYFYPADLTPGCTKQACAFRDDMAKLKDQGVDVVGVSGDTVENHKLFKKVHKLNFTLLADEDGSVAKAFGVPSKVGQAIFPYAGKDGSTQVLTRGATTQRWTFVIDKDGKVIHKDMKVKADQDSKAVLKAVAAAK